MPPVPTPIYERQPMEVWSQLERTRYLPQVMAIVEQTLCANTCLVM